MKLVPNKNLIKALKILALTVTIFLVNTNVSYASIDSKPVKKVSVKTKNRFQEDVAKRSLEKRSSRKSGELRKKNTKTNFFYDSKSSKKSDKIVSKVYERHNGKVNTKHVEKVVNLVYKKLPDRDMKIPPRVVFAIIDSETTWKAKQRSIDGSSYGSLQVNYRIWKKMCNLSNPKDLYVPSTNVTCGLKVLEYYYQRNNGNIRRTLEAYRGSTNKSVNRQYASVILNKANYFM